MFSAIQVLLMIVVAVLTTLSVVIGIQVFRLIRQLRRAASNFQLFLKKQDRINNFSRLVGEDIVSSGKKKKSSQDLSSFVSVGFGPRASSSPSSRSFYRNRRNLS